MAPQLAVADKKMEKKLEEAKKRHGREERKEVVVQLPWSINVCKWLMASMEASSILVAELSC